MRDWCSGNMFDSKSNAVGSIPTSRAMTFSVKGTRKLSVFGLLFYFLVVKIKTEL